MPPLLVGVVGGRPDLPCRPHHRPGQPAEIHGSQDLRPPGEREVAAGLSRQAWRREAERWSYGGARRRSCGAGALPSRCHRRHPRAAGARAGSVPAGAVPVPGAQITGRRRPSGRSSGQEGQVRLLHARLQQTGSRHPPGAPGQEALSRVADLRHERRGDGLQRAVRGGGMPLQALPSGERSLAPLALPPEDIRRGRRAQRRVRHHARARQHGAWANQAAPYPRRRWPLCERPELWTGRLRGGSGAEAQAGLQVDQTQHAGGARRRLLLQDRGYPGRLLGRGHFSSRLELFGGEGKQGDILFRFCHAVRAGRQGLVRPPVGGDRADG
mmetsp:Transcript_60621/g.187780  ORF Transcript_60621/g.187780 Transcript_60621/m.187780 type:complete len:327 (+) Transcript_60621:52-1032(+)